MTPPIDSSWLGGVIGAAIVAVLAYFQQRKLAGKVRSHGDDIAALKAAKASHDVQMSRLTPAAPHEKHCSSTEQLHRALHVERDIHRHHEPPKP